MFIVEGLVAQFIILIIMMIILVATQTRIIQTSISGIIPVLRTMPGLNAINEGIGRAVEMNRPVTYVLGASNFNGPHAIAALSVLSYTVNNAARLGSPIVVAFAGAELIPLVTSITKEAYALHSRSDLYTDDSIQWLSNDWGAKTTGITGIIASRRPALNVMMGAFYAEAVMYGEVGSSVGAIQVAGSDRLDDLCFLFTTCDYMLIGEELYAAGAYLSNNVPQLGTIVGQDYLKILAILLMILGAITITLNPSWGEALLNLLST